MNNEQSSFNIGEDGAREDENTNAAGAGSAQGCDGERPPVQVGKISRICAGCGIVFYVKFNSIRTRYHSRQCCKTQTSNKTPVPCHECGKIVYRTPCELKRAKLVFCCAEHKNSNRDFIDKVSKKRGDAQRYGGEGKTYVKLGGRHMHRVVMEQKIGRKLKRGEIVHHIDGNKRNNDPDNLMITTQSEHLKLHLPEMIRIQAEGNTHAKGESSAMSKLTEAAVLDIRSSYPNSATTRELAEKYGVKKETVRYVIKRRTWKHI
jgi:hypothetical protein